MKTIVEHVHNTHYQKLKIQSQNVKVLNNYILLQFVIQKRLCIKYFSHKI
jgi:hypothetical protein